LTRKARKAAASAAGHTAEPPPGACSTSSAARVHFEADHAACSGAFELLYFSTPAYAFMMRAAARACAVSPPSANSSAFV